jgi:hypothetical protein
MLSIARVAAAWHAVQKVLEVHAVQVIGQSVHNLVVGYPYCWVGHPEAETHEYD